MYLVSPRFDTWWQACLNVVAVVVFVAICVVLIWSWRRGRAFRARDLLLLINVSIGGVYLPILPLIWLAMERDDNRMPDGSVRLPFGVSTDLKAARPDAPRTGSVPPAASWWGGFFAGPLLGLMAYLSEPRDTLGRAHGAAAAVFWSLILAVLAPLSARVLLFGTAEPASLLYALPVVLVVTVGACINGTIQGRRERTALGRSLDDSTKPVNA